MATNINSNKVRAAIENLKAHNLKLDFNCPRLVSDLTQAMHKILKPGISLEDLKTEKYSMILYYKMLTQANHIYTKEIQENLERFEEILEEKEIQALAEGKKLLVIFGENHDLQISTFYEMIFYTVLRNKDFNSALVEASKKSLKTFHKDSYKISSMLSWKFMEEVLEMELIPIDPYNNHGDLGFVRCNAINQAIASNDSNNQVAIVGARHLSHIVNSPEVNSKFIIFPVDVGMSHHRYPKDVYNLISADEITEDNSDIPTGTLKLSFQSLIESFSVNKLLTIYTDLLPAILHEAPFPEETIYNSDFSEDHSFCKAFENMPTAETMELITLATNKYYSEHEL